MNIDQLTFIVPEYFLENINHLMTEVNERVKSLHGSSAMKTLMQNYNQIENEDQLRHLAELKKAHSMIRTKDEMRIFIRMFPKEILPDLPMVCMCYDVTEAKDRRDLIY